MSEVKGTAVAASLRYASEKLGPQSYRRMLESLSEEERHVVENGILASGWYPVDMLVHVMESAIKVSGDPHMPHEMGRASADYSLTTIYKIFFKVGSPQFVISKAGAVFKTYYTAGQMNATVSEKGHAVLEATGFESNPLLCERITGWMERTLELSGAQGPRLVHTQCVCRGDALCRYEGRWD